MAKRKALAVRLRVDAMRPPPGRTSAAAVARNSPASATCSTTSSASTASKRRPLWVRPSAAAAGLAIDYRCAAAEDLTHKGLRFDAVLALEVVEHVADAGLFLATAAALVRPGGGLIASTLNRTAKAFLFAIVGAEYVLGWLPRGTHDWRKFLRPSELAGYLRKNGLEIGAIEGLSYDPRRRTWRMGGPPDVNYLLFASNQTEK